MPKYYINDGTEHTIIEADSPLQACFRAIKHRFESVPLNGFYRVSELGLEPHEDDVIFSADEVIHALMDIIERQQIEERKRPDIEDQQYWDEKRTRRKRKKPKKDEEED